MTTASHDVRPGSVPGPLAAGEVTAASGRLVEVRLHGHPLSSWASAGLAAAGAVDSTSWSWSDVRDSGIAWVLVDARSPLTPPEFIASCVRRALETGAVVLGVRQVTDTVKAVTGGHVGHTVDRDGLVALAAPLVLPPDVVARLADRPGPDLPGVVTRLRADHRVEFVAAPALARRVSSTVDVMALEVLTPDVRTLPPPADPRRR